MLAKQLKMKRKNKKEDFLDMFLGTLGVILLGHLSTGKGLEWSKIPRWGVIRVDEGAIRASQDF